MPNKSKKTTSFYSRRLFLLVLLGLTFAFAVYWLHFHKNISTLPNTNKSSLGVAKKSNVSTQSAPVSQKNPSGNQIQAGNPTGAANINLLGPYGTFVSNHHPTTGDTEESVCSSTAGASCYIQFMNGSTVKKLDPEDIGSEGSVAWTWKVSMLGPGTWKVTAVANMNGQTKTTDDAILMEVK
jgi:hypothetical protein